MTFARARARNSTRTRSSRRSHFRRLRGHHHSPEAARPRHVKPAGPTTTHHHPAKTAERSQRPRCPRCPQCLPIEKTHEPKARKARKADGPDACAGAGKDMATTGPRQKFGLGTTSRLHDCTCRPASAHRRPAPCRHQCTHARVRTPSSDSTRTHTGECNQPALVGPAGRPTQHRGGTRVTAARRSCRVRGDGSAGRPAHRETHFRVTKTGRTTARNLQVATLSQPQNSPTKNPNPN